MPVQTRSKSLIVAVSAPIPARVKATKPITQVQPAPPPVRKSPREKKQEEKQETREQVHEVRVQKKKTTKTLLEKRLENSKKKELEAEKQLLQKNRAIAWFEWKASLLESFKDHPLLTYLRKLKSINSI